MTYNVFGGTLNPAQRLADAAEQKMPRISSNDVTLTCTIFSLSSQQSCQLTSAPRQNVCISSASHTAFT